MSEGIDKLLANYFTNRYMEKIASDIAAGNSLTADAEEFLEQVAGRPSHAQIKELQRALQIIAQRRAMSQGATKQGHKSFELVRRQLQELMPKTQKTVEQIVKPDAAAKRDVRLIDMIREYAPTAANARRKKPVRHRNFRN